MPKLFSSSPLILGIIDDIDLGKIQKSTFCQRSGISDDDGLSMSVMQKGLLQPIIVRPKADGFEIIAGNRRYEACKRLGWRKILCHIVEMDDREAFEVSIAENIQRQNLSIIDEARAFQAYTSRYGWGGMSELANKIGKSVQYVERRVRLLDLPPDVIESVTSLDISSSIAEELLSLKNKEYQSDFAKLAREKQLSSRVIRDLVKEFQGVASNKLGDVDTFYAKIKDVDESTQRAFDKSITILKLAMHRLTSVMEDMEDNWIIYETLKHHRSVIHDQIDLLIKEKKKI